MAESDVAAIAHSWTPLFIDIDLIFSIGTVRRRISAQNLHVQHGTRSGNREMKRLLRSDSVATNCVQKFASIEILFKVFTRKEDKVYSGPST